MLENCSLDTENFQAPWRYSPDYKPPCLLHPTEGHGITSRLSKTEEKNHIYKAEGEKLFNLSGIQHGFIETFLYIHGS